MLGLLNKFIYPRSFNDYLHAWGIQTNPVAKVIEIDRKVKGALSLWLDIEDLPWSVNDYLPGQYVLVTLKVNGRLQNRCFSVSEYNAKLDKIKLGVRINPDGLVTNYMADSLNVGDEVQISEPKGDFVMPSDAKSILMVAGGSGITPISAMLQEQLEADSSARKQIDLLYFTPNQEVTLQQSFINDCDESLDSLSVKQVFTEQDKKHFDAVLLESLGLNIKNYDAVMVCGPEEMKQAAKVLVNTQNPDAVFMSEDFHVSFDSEEVNTELSIRFLQSQHEVQNSAATILESAEADGLELTSGCRQGVCHLCSCEKVSGSVKNLLTGEISNQHNESIQLCISKALSDVELNR